MNRMNHAVNTVRLCPQSLLSLPNGFMNKVVIMAGIEVLHGLSNVRFHSPQLTWLSPPLSAQSISSRHWHWVSCLVPFPEAISQLPCGRLIISWKGQCFVLTGIDTLDRELPSLHRMLLSKQPSMDFQNALSIIMVFYIALLLIKKLISQQKELWQWVHAHGIHWSYHVSHHPKEAGLTEH